MARELAHRIRHCDLHSTRLGSGYTRTMAEIQRRKTPTVKIGHVRAGWEVPVVVQSMTNTDTADVESTIEQVAALALAGS